MKIEYLMYLEVSKIMFAFLNIIFLVETYPILSICISGISLFTSSVVISVLELGGEPAAETIIAIIAGTGVITAVMVEATGSGVVIGVIMGATILSVVLALIAVITGIGWGNWENKNDK